jgi:hypothetical protein
MSTEHGEVIAISLNLKDLARTISGRLNELADKPIGFVLVVSVGHSAQYVSNTNRDDGMALLQTVLAAWEGKRKDIPAHCNPDLES